MLSVKQLYVAVGLLALVAVSATLFAACPDTKPHSGACPTGLLVLCAGFQPCPSPSGVPGTLNNGPFSTEFAAGQQAVTASANESKPEDVRCYKDCECTATTNGACVPGTRQWWRYYFPVYKVGPKC
jgi:hypothetical protein